jgi:AcrR family transcriptional regulator
MPLSSSPEVSDISADHAQIALAALRLVGELGADRVTVADVAKNLSVSPAEMARGCRSEGDLWRITVGFIAQQMFESWRESLDKDLSPTERLRSLLALQIEFIVQTPALRDVLFSRRLHQNYSAVTRELSRVRRHFQHLLAQAVAEGIAAGDFQRAPGADETAHRIIEMLQALVLSWSLALEPDFSLEHVWMRLDAILGCSAGRDEAAAASGVASASSSRSDQ